MPLPGVGVAPNPERSLRLRGHIRGFAVCKFASDLDKWALVFNVDHLFDLRLQKGFSLRRWLRRGLLYLVRGDTLGRVGRAYGLIARVCAA